ncbi:MAG: hypothetical protein KDA65_02745 [Planctomycetaceae bacterium]|nr:hypothetical protein [Planctomycetaceae bacterium]
MRLNFWTWDGHFVIVSEQRINPDEEALKAMLTEEAFNSLSGPWRYWFPTGLVCLVLGIIGMVIYKRTRPTFADEAKTILSDPRYKNVVEQMKREQLELEAWVKSDDWKQSENWKSSNGMDFDDIHEEIHSRQNTMITNSVQNLVDVGIDPELAEKNLRKVIEYLSHQEEKETDSIENG